MFPSETTVDIIFLICPKDDVIEVYLMREISPGQEAIDNIKKSVADERQVRKRVAKQVLATASDLCFCPQLPKSADGTRGSSTATQSKGGIFPVGVIYCFT